MNIILPQIAKDLASGKIPLQTYIEECLGNISLREKTIQALIPEENRKERLTKEAIALEKKYPNADNRPPLFGILVGVKDLFRVDGFETRAGSNLPAKLFEGPESHVITQLKNAGALILGKTITTEFAFMEPGPTRNPHNQDHTPGGSSSGSAAAVSCNYCSFALGTQTIGSISRPAAFCGVVGFKPSYGNISTKGVIPFSISADHVGFFTHTVSGAKLIASILYEKYYIINNISKKPVIAIPDGNYLAQTDKKALLHFENTVMHLSNNGYTIKRIQVFENIEKINQQHYDLILTELASYHSNWFHKYKLLYREKTRESIEKGLNISKEKFENGFKERFNLRNLIQQTMHKENIDIWIAPSAIGAAPVGINSTGSPLMNLPWTHAGLPTISIPSGFIDNLPLGIQLIGDFDHDADLLSFAEMIEKDL